MTQLPKADLSEAYGPPASKTKSAESGAALGQADGLAG